MYESTGQCGLSNLYSMAFVEGGGGGVCLTYN